jgi:hypothetical protein
MQSTSQYLRGVVEHEKILPKLGQGGVGNLVLDSFLSYIYNYTMCTFLEQQMYTVLCYAFEL